MGDWCPPYYGMKTIMDKVNEVAKIDVKINELLIKREQCVADLKKSIEEENNRKK